MAPSLLDVLVELRKRLSKCSRLLLPADTDTLQNQVDKLVNLADYRKAIAQADSKQLRR